MIIQRDLRIAVKPVTSYGRKSTTESGYGVKAPNPSPDSFSGATHRRSSRSVIG